MPIPVDVVKCFKYIDLRAKDYIEELRSIIQIPNISKDLKAMHYLEKNIQWMNLKLKSLGFVVVVKNPDYGNYMGNNPTITTGTLIVDSNRPTLLYYCHLDVLKVELEKWETEPFTMTEKDGKLYGRGTAKMKGPLLCFLHAIECYQDLGIELPVNIKIICESMNECKSRGLQGVLETLKATFLPDVECVLLTESHWLGRDYPCIIYGARGICYFTIHVKGPNRDLSSGDYGGVVQEPMEDLICIFNRLVDPFGKILIPGFYDDVLPVTPDEEEFYKKIQIELKEYRDNVGVNKLGYKEHLKVVLMHVWRYPWFNVHYIHNTCCDKATSISKEVFARFSFRIVPHQKQEKVVKMVIGFMTTLTEKMCTPNKIDIKSEFPLDPWLENHQHWNYQAANIATKQVYKEEANYIREGNGFPTLLKLKSVLPKRNILMLPIVNCESQIHTSQENISVHCYIEGTKLLVSYFYNLRESWKKHMKSKTHVQRRNVCRDFL